jgi:hypothetical protein
MGSIQPSDNPEQEASAGCLANFIGGIITFIIGIILCCLASLFTGCSSSRYTSSLEQHHIQDLMQRMDSLFTTRTVVQQDSAWRETILRQFQTIREKSDTSHQIVVDTAGRVIKEKLVINNVREVHSETDRQELQVMTHRLESMDSTINIMRQQISRSDSLLRQRHETVTKEVEKPLSWWQELQIWLGRLVLIALAVLAAIWILKKKLPWLP